MGQGVSFEEGRYFKQDQVPLDSCVTPLIGLESSIQTVPIEKIWTPEPDMYSMKACIGRLCKTSASLH